MKEKAACLLSIKSIITLITAFVFAYLAIKGTIEPDSVMIIVTTVFSFYFGTQHEKKVAAPAEKIEQQNQI